MLFFDACKLSDYALVYAQSIMEQFMLIKCDDNLDSQTCWAGETDRISICPGPPVAFLPTGGLTFSFLLDGKESMEHTHCWYHPFPEYIAF